MDSGIKRRIVREVKDVRGYYIVACYRNFITWYEVFYWHKNSPKEVMKDFSEYDEAEIFGERWTTLIFK